MRDGALFCSWVGEDKWEALNESDSAQENEKLARFSVKLVVLCGSDGGKDRGTIQSGMHRKGNRTKAPQYTLCPGTSR